MYIERSEQYCCYLYFLLPMYFFKKDILSKYLHEAAFSSTGSPDEPLLILVR